MAPLDTWQVTSKIISWRPRRGGGNRVDIKSRHQASFRNEANPYIIITQITHANFRYLTQSLKVSTCRKVPGSSMRPKGVSEPRNLRAFISGNSADLTCSFRAANRHEDLQPLLQCLDEWILLVRSNPREINTLRKSKVCFGQGIPIG